MINENENVHMNMTADDAEEEQNGKDRADYGTHFMWFILKIELGKQCFPNLKIFQ